MTVNRPKVLNALNHQVLAELHAAVAQVAQSETARVVILTGAGDRAFVAGADIAAMAEMTPAQARELAQRGHALGDAIAQLGQPVLAAVNGYALGGGLELALQCDAIYASSKARFGQPEVNVGVLPGFGGTQRLPRLVGPGRAAEMIFTGEPIDATEALRSGLVNAVFEPEKLIVGVTALAHKIAGRAPRAVAASKRALRAAQELPLSQGNQAEQDLFTALFMTADQKEGMRAFLEKRPPSFTGK